MRWIVCAAGMLMAAASADAASYRLDMSVKRAGTTVAAPTVVVEEGQQRELILQDPKNPRSKVRMLVSAEPAPHPVKGGDVIWVKIRLFEQAGNDWVLRHEPSLGVYAGIEATLTIGPEKSRRTAPEYELRVTADRFDPALEQGGDTL